MDEDELLSVAHLALAEAISDFDSTKGMLFRRWAYLKMYRRIVDHGRKLAGNRVKFKVTSDIEKFNSGVADEVPNHLRYDYIGIQGTLVALHVEQDGVDPLENQIDGEAIVSSDLRTRLDAKLLLEELMSGLAPRSVRALLLYYFDGYSQKEIGEMLHINESRACQILLRAKEKMRMVEYEGRINGHRHRRPTAASA